jgi:hypothetical protein
MSSIFLTYSGVIDESIILMMTFTVIRCVTSLGKIGHDSSL